MSYAKFGGMALMIIVLTGLAFTIIPHQDGDDPTDTNDEQRKVPELVTRTFTMSDVILDSQDPYLGYRVFEVENGGTFSLPGLVSDDPEKVFLGWSPYDDGREHVLRPGSRLLVCEDVVIMYGIWEQRSPTAVA